MPARVSKLASAGGDYGLVKLEIYNLLGEKVATLVDEELAPGTYTAEWDAIGVSSGIYVYNLRLGNAVQAKKIVLLR